MGELRVGPVVPSTDRVIDQDSPTKGKPDTAEATRQSNANKKAAREPHRQSLDKPARATDSFEGAQLVCFLSNWKVNKKGEPMLEFLVPHEYRHLAVPLMSAYSVPLSVDVQQWRPYRAARGDDPGEQAGRRADADD